MSSGAERHPKRARGGAKKSTLGQSSANNSSPPPSDTIFDDSPYAFLTPGSSTQRPSKAARSSADDTAPAVATAASKKKTSKGGKSMTKGTRQARNPDGGSYWSASYIKQTFRKGKKEGWPNDAPVPIPPYRISGAKIRAWRDMSAAGRKDAEATWKAMSLEDKADIIKQVPANGKPIPKTMQDILDRLSNKRKKQSEKASKKKKEKQNHATQAASTDAERAAAKVTKPKSKSSSNFRGRSVRPDEPAKMNDSNAIRNERSMMIHVAEHTQHITIDKEKQVKGEPHCIMAVVIG